MSSRGGNQPPEKSASLRGALATVQKGSVIARSEATRQSHGAVRRLPRLLAEPRNDRRLGAAGTEETGG